MRLITNICADPSSREQFVNTETLFSILKLPWLFLNIDSQSDIIRKTKCKVISMFPKIGIKAMSENILEVLDLALQDQSADVRAEAVASMPILAFNPSYDIITAMCKRLE